MRVGVFLGPTMKKEERNLDQAATQTGGCGPAQAKKKPEEERGAHEEKESRERVVACGVLISFGEHRGRQMESEHRAGNVIVYCVVH